MSGKVSLLYEEMLAARKWGPTAESQNSGWSDSGSVRMYDATRLAHRLLPEVSLHYSVEGTTFKRLHKLEYVVVRDQWHGRATIDEIGGWLRENAPIMESEMVEQAIALLWKITETVIEPQQRQPIYKGLSVLRKKLQSSKSA